MQRDVQFMKYGRVVTLSDYEGESLNTRENDDFLLLNM